MRYEVLSDVIWDELPPTDTLAVAEHFAVPVDHDSIVLIPRGGPTWLRMHRSAFPILEDLHGRTIGELRNSGMLAKFQPLLEETYRRGLLFVGGKTGFRVEPTIAGSTRGGKPRSLLLKMTGACDIACTYCYDYDPDRWSGQFDADTAKRLISECLEPGHKLTLMFHGGEPLLRFEMIRHLVDFSLKLAASVGAVVGFSIQTNGMQLTQDVIDFLSEHHFGIGISIDGSERVHNTHRIDHKGNGTFARIREKFDRFPNFMRKDVGYISVVTERTLPYLDETWDFFREMRVQTLKLIPSEPEGRGVHLTEGATFIAGFVDFLRRRMDEILAGCVGLPYLLNITQLIEPFLSVQRKNMCMKLPCGAASDLLVLDAKRQMRACDCSYHPAFLLDQDPNASVAMATGSVSAQALHRRVDWLTKEAECSTCTWLHHCAGTCPARAVMRKGTIYAVDDLECATRLHLFPTILNDVSSDPSSFRSYYQRYTERGRSSNDLFSSM